MARLFPPAAPKRSILLQMWMHAWILHLSSLSFWCLSFSQALSSSVYVFLSELCFEQRDPQLFIGGERPCKSKISWPGSHLSTKKWPRIGHVKADFYFLFLCSSSTWPRCSPCRKLGFLAIQPMHASTHVCFHSSSVRVVDSLEFSKHLTHACISSRTKPRCLFLMITYMHLFDLEL